MTKSTAQLDRMIDAVPVETRNCCGVCNDQKLSRAVARWLERRAAGEVLPSMHTMHRQLFGKIAKTSAATLSRHICKCLGLDHRTGRKL